MKARMMTDGRITIPKSVRERLGLRPGDELAFVEDKSGFRLRKHLPDFPFRKYRGYLKELAGQDPDDLIEETRGR
jgi:antitoxin PrlF